MSTIEITDFPKLHSPFLREENDSGDYVVQDEVNDGYEWVFEHDGVRAVEKLDGTNTSIVLDEEGDVTDIYTRLDGGEGEITQVPLLSERYPFITKGVVNALSRGWFTDLEPNTQHYGELIGPKVNGNPYDLEEHLFVPFEYLYQNVYYESWGEYPKTYDVISGWFKDELLPLFYARIHNIEFSDLPEDAYVEGIVFTHPDGRKAKLRRDMFDWYDGERH